MINSQLMEYLKALYEQLLCNLQVNKKLCCVSKMLVGFSVFKQLMIYTIHICTYVRKIYTYINIYKYIHWIKTKCVSAAP